MGFVFHDTQANGGCMLERGSMSYGYGRYAGAISRNHFSGFFRVLASMRHRIEHNCRFFLPHANEIQRYTQGIQIENGGSTWHQHDVCRSDGHHCCIADCWRGVDEHPKGVVHLFEDLRQARGLGGDHLRRRRLAPISPVRRGRLGIEIDEGSLDSRSGGGDGQIDRYRRLACSTFLRNNANNPHVVSAMHPKMIPKFAIYTCKSQPEMALVVGKPIPAFGGFTNP